MENAINVGDIAKTKRGYTIDLPSVSVKDDCSIHIPKGTYGIIYGTKSNDINSEITIAFPLCNNLNDAKESPIVLRISHINPNEVEKIKSNPQEDSNQKNP